MEENPGARRPSGIRSEVPRRGSAIPRWTPPPSTPPAEGGADDNRNPLEQISGPIENAGPAQAKKIPVLRSKPKTGTVKRKVPTVPGNRSRNKTEQSSTASRIATPVQKLKMAPSPRSSPAASPKVSRKAPAQNRTKKIGDTAPTGDSQASKRSPDNDALLAFTQRRAEALQAKVSAEATDADQIDDDSSFGHIRVFCRMRPRADNQKSSDVDGVVISDEETVVVTDSRHNMEDAKFKFNRVFPTTTTQTEVFDTACRPLVDAVLRGYNGTLIAYGQTGSGKTHTMGSMSSYSPSGGYMSATSDGMIPKVVDDLFARAADDPEHTYKLSFMYVQVYQEEVYDLLSRDSAAKKPHALREHRRRGVYIEDIFPTEVSTSAELMALLAAGRRRLVVAETKMNRHSSRSHALATIFVEKLLKTEDNGDDEVELLVRGKLTLCDLAGSERIKKTGSEDTRLTEAQKINGSLLELGNVVAALADPNHTFVPFRNSTLTRLLQESLGGNCKTSLIICASTLARDNSETKGTLQFGHRAMSVIQKARINVELDYRHLANELAEELEQKTEQWRRLAAKYKRQIKELESSLAEARTIHNASHDELTQMLADVREEAANKIHEKEEDVEFRIAEVKAAAAEREAELDAKVTELTEKAAATAFVTATKMKSAQKKQQSSEQEISLLHELVAELEGSVEDIREEINIHDAKASEAAVNAAAEIASLKTRVTEEAEARIAAEKAGQDAVAVEVERGRAAVATREAELRSEVIPVEVAKKVASEMTAFRSQIEADLRAEHEVQESKRATEHASKTESHRVQLEKELRAVSAAEQAAWIAEKNAETEAFQAGLRREAAEKENAIRQKLEAEFEAKRLTVIRGLEAQAEADRNVWHAEQQRAALDHVAQQMVHSAVAFACMEVPERIRHAETVTSFERQLEELRQNNASLKNEVADLHKRETDRLAAEEAAAAEAKRLEVERIEQARLEKERREAEEKEKLRVAATVENDAFHPTPVVRDEIQEPNQDEIAARKKKKFLLCC